MSIGDALEKSKDNISKIYARIAEKKDKREIIALLEELDINDMILNDPVMIRELALLRKQHINVIGSIIRFEDIDNAVLGTLVEASENVYVGKLGATAEELKSFLIQAVIGELSPAEFTKQLATTGLSKSQANVLVSDTIMKFERGVTVQMQLQSGEPDRLYNWRGPIDSKTSQNDLDVIAQNPQTMAQLDARLNDGAIGGAHPNCRHFAEPQII